MNEWEKAKFYSFQVYKNYIQTEYSQKMMLFYSLANQISTNQKEHVYSDVQDACATLCNQQEQNYKQQKATLDMKKKDNQEEKDVQI